MQPEQAKFLLNFYVPSLRQEFEATKRILAAIPEDKREYTPDPRCRNAMELAWHIVSAEIWFLDGIINGQFGPEEERMPTHIRTVADVLAWYEQNLPDLLAKAETLPDEALLRCVPFFGVANEPAVTYFSFLMVHTVHHRGQLSVYLRPMGAKVPSIYGGSADVPFQMAAQQQTP